MSDHAIPQKCETDDCHRGVQYEVNYYSRMFDRKESGPTYRCGPCADCLLEGSTFGRSDTTKTLVRDTCNAGGQQ